jgi:hypothetical protein
VPLVAVMPEVKLMAVMMVAEMPAAGMTPAVAATMAAMTAAGGCVARCRKRGGGQRNGGNGGKEWSRGFHGRCGDEAIGGRLNKKTRPGEACPGGPFIAICLVRGVADVDAALVHRAPAPAVRVAVVVEVAVVPVVPVVAVVAVVVVAVVVMAMVAVMAVAMTAAVPAAGRRVARGGEGRNGQHEGRGSGGEDSTVHFKLLLGCSRATIALGCALLVPRGARK